jgi:diguanylate cyclase (GGDEF)-like protein
MAAKSENTTRSVKGLLDRQAVLAETQLGLGDRTDTVGVLLRVTPNPGLMVVTNEAAAREELMAILAASDMQVLAPKGPAAVLETLRTERQAIIVTDDHEMTRALRALSPESYIVLITGDGENDYAVGVEAGADDCIPRHATPAVVLARLRIARRTAHVETSLRQVQHENRRLSTTDPLTKVANRHFFARHFPLEVQRATRKEQALSLVMCDIDHFKRVNDTYGHATGDAVLREFGARVQKCVRRGTDWIARIGGEEFAIILPETELQPAVVAAKKIRDCLRATPFHCGRRKIPVTASFGVAGMWKQARFTPEVPTRLQAAADAALYRSKDTGRDRVTAVQVAPGSHTSRKRQ